MPSLFSMEGTPSCGIPSDISSKILLKNSLSKAHLAFLNWMIHFKNIATLIIGNTKKNITPEARAAVNEAIEIVNANLGYPRDTPLTAPSWQEDALLKTISQLPLERIKYIIPYISSHIENVENIHKNLQESK